MTGSATWNSLLAGETNVVAELTSGRLRCSYRRETHRLRSEELHAAAWLLGLTRVPVARTAALAGSAAG